MTGRERFLSVLNHEKPDRLPCQVHSWIKYYLNTYLNGMDQYQAYEYFDMDPVIYVSPRYIYADADLALWQSEYVESPRNKDGEYHWREIIHTPKGTLMHEGDGNQYTGWTTKHLIQNEKDFELWNQYVALPVTVDWTPVVEAKNRIGDKGIVRGSFFDFGQGSPWQSFCILHDTEKTIMAAIDKPDWIEHVLRLMLNKKLEVISRAGKIEFDLVETGGGAGSSTVISPAFHRRFCLPYDRIQHEALHKAGTKTVYHLCGGLMPLLEIVAENGSDGLETMTPSAMGGDCDLAGSHRRVGDKLFFIGGFDQNKGFENGNPKLVREMVLELFNACPNGGYICSPSDHFFFGNNENIRAFANAAKACVYK
jgi:uroporphyrinogen-III decarboxylase